MALYLLIRGLKCRDIKPVVKEQTSVQSLERPRADLTYQLPGFGLQQRMKEFNKLLNFFI